MKLQYVFGNPTRAKKKRSKSVAKKKKRLKRNPQITTVTSKVLIGKKKITKGPRKGKFKNIYEVDEVRKGNTVASRGDLWKTKTALSQAKTDIAYLRGGKKGKTVAERKKIDSSIELLQKKYKTVSDNLKKGRAARTAELTAIRTLVRDIKDSSKVSKAKVSASKTEWKTGGTVAKKKKKKATRKKSASKKKATRKKSASKKKATRKKSTRKKSTRKKSASKKKATRKKSTRRKSTTRKKRQSSSATVAVYAPKTKRYKKRKVKVNVKANPRKRRRNPFSGLIKRGNPMKVAGMKVAGYDTMELAELGVGGLFYGMANSYISPMFAKVPGLGKYAGALGGTLPSLIAGMGLNILSDKIRNAQAKKALCFLGDGLLGAAVVGAGVSLSQTVLGGAMGNVDYIPAGGKNDFGGVDFTPALGNIEYTPMGNVDFFPGANQPGANQAADFGAYEESTADFGEIPEGLN